MSKVFTFLWLSDDAFREKYEPLVDRWNNQSENSIQQPITNFGRAILLYWKINDDVRNEYDELIKDMGNCVSKLEKDNQMEVINIATRASNETSTEN